MSCFKLPISLCNQIQSILTRFWWDEKPDKRKMSWVAWSKLTHQKNAGGLGFRELESFNNALLAKIGWQLLTSPESLLGRVLLGKYCHQSSFMECKPPSNISHGWRSILAGRETLPQGLGWCIGNGEDINLWNEPWLSTSQPVRPTGPAPHHSAHLKVASLINPETNQWDTAAIKQILPHHEEEIKSIPLSKARRRDRLTWLPVKRGEYTTRSGYGLLTTPAVPPQVRNFNWQANIWNIRTLPKIKNFLWKATAGALPVSNNLFSRGIQVDQNCKRCGSPETTIHLLVECPFAQQTWSLAPLNRLPRPGYESVCDFLQEIKASTTLPPTGVTSSSLYSWILWNLWTARNALIFEDKSFSPVEIITKAIGEAKQWHAAQKEAPKPRIPQALQNTEPPPGSTLCYVDAAWQQQTQCCGMGWVYGDPSGAYSRTSMRRHVSSALAAEAWAIRAALLHLQTKDYDAVHIFSDSLTLVNLLRADDFHNEVHAILCDIKELRDSFRLFSISFIPRLQNVQADALAKQALVECLPGLSGF